ncbi:MAG: hypothetical protein IT327_32205 [Anaerolineae bacterium]|nr:hypothetical protein [Anaerolineae bacterium]
MSPTAFVLSQPLTAQRPSRWDIHARYAFHRSAEPLWLPAHTWLLALPEAADSPSASPQYRLADGSVVFLEAPLTVDQADPLTDSQALTALAAYRPLEEAVLAEWGLQVEQIDTNAPFRLIQCPLCGGTRFTTVAFAQVWCDGCYAQFSVRSTAGDPGFVVDCTWSHYQPDQAHYLLPRSDDLLLTLVFKDSGNPLELTHSRHCHRDDCTPAKIALTDGKDTPLRAGLHACAIGDVYDWMFYGHVPTFANRSTERPHELHWPDKRPSQFWPAIATAHSTGLHPAEQQALQQAATLLAEHAPPGHYRERISATLAEVAARPTYAPYLGFRSPWPRRKHLQSGEKYLLYRWLMVPTGTSDFQTACPLWLVVTSLGESPHGDRWLVMRDNLCPHCGEPVTAAEMATAVDEKRPWQYPHGACRESWQQHGWQPTLFGSEK